MAIKSQHFDKVYFVGNPEILSDRQMDELLMVSTKNWNYYLCDLGKKINKKLDYKEIKNVELAEFDSERKMFNFLKKLDDKLLIDFSIEYKKPCILKLI